MRYKYQLPFRVKKAAELYLMDYQRNKKALETLKEDMVPSMTQQLTGMPKGTGGQRQTEDLAIKIANDPYVRQLEDSIASVERVMHRLTDEERRFCDLVYFRKTHTIVGAGEVIGMTPNPAYAMANRILGRIAEEKGLIQKRVKNRP